ncbi:MAG: putative lipid II flippase FtsW [Actinobacteria bacterium]|uniref:peptidoglycan glycosyltransferase n=1 Tax=freshwater metagenome TaxID=449393 RepID=A0A6J5ZG13_9ZZZZ|nr:putative lipid II flippase FtsW [Actinomycetota bacterium]
MARASAAAQDQPLSRREARSRSRTTEEDVLLTAVLCLVAFGAVMVYSASSAPSVLSGTGDGTDLLIRYVVFAGLGFLALYVAARFPLRRLIALTGPFLAVSFGLLLLVKIPGIGVSVNGAQRWLGSGIFRFQPSEFAKLALVLYTARFLADKPQGFKRSGELLPVALVVGGAMVLVATQPDLGTALVVAATCGAMLVATGIPFRWLAGYAGAGATLVLLYSLSAPYRRDRLTSFIDPWHHASTTGFQAVQGQIAIGSGGIFGRGLGQSVQKIFYLPEAHTDFILAIVGEELGILGLLALLVLYALVAWAGLQIARSATSRYAKMLAAGLTSLIVCQALLNLFAVLGIFPLTGVPLPFMSYGSTSLVTLLVAVGLLLNIARGGAQSERPLVDGPNARRSEDDHADELSDRSRGNRRPRSASTRGRRRAAH